MEALVRSQQESPVELNFLTDWERDHARERKAGTLSLTFHIAGVVALLLIPRSVVTPTPREATRVTPLIEPLTELTQKPPTKGKITKEISAEMAPRPRIQIPPSLPSTSRAPARQSSPAPPPPPQPLPEPPRIDAQRGLPPGPQVAQVSPPPQIQPEEKPKLAFETPTAPPSGGKGKIPIPDTSVSHAIRSLAHGGGEGGQTVGDDTSEPGIGGIGAGLNLPPSPGHTGSALQLLSDPLGVDFRPYLLQVLAAVRRNWFPIIPESARLGRLRGKVEIQFSVSRNGAVPKLVIILPSGTEALDRAAVAGISASNPFPPLPTEFAGQVIRLQLTFSYNIPKN
jgi:TonB family protein